MSEDPRPSDQYIAQVVAVYAAAEQYLLTQAAGILRRLTPTFEGPFLALSRLRALVRGTVEKLAPLDEVARAGIMQAAQDGTTTALAPTGGGAGQKPPDPPRGALTPTGPEPFNLSMPHGERAAQAIANDVVSALQDVRYRITRLPDDIYKLISPQAAMGQVLDNNVTPEQAQAVAWRVFTERGITGFVDKSGRNWSLSAYVEMSVRTAAARAFNDSHMQTMRALGVKYFTVPVHGAACPLCWPWQGAVLVDTPIPHPEIPVDATIAQAVAAGLFHPNCFPGFVPVSAPSGVSAADSRWYEGELVVIHTAAGNELSVTPNHPVLTPEGWVAAGDLVVGQSVVRNRANVERVDVVRPDDEQVEAPIGDVFDALRHASGVTAVSVPASAEQFHGDGGDSDVEVVLVDGLLEDGREASLGEEGGDRALFVGGVRFELLLGDRTADEFAVRSLDTTDSIMRGSGDRGTLCARHAGEALGHGGAQVGAVTTTQEPRADRGLADAESLADLALGQAGFAEIEGLIYPSRGLGALGRSERFGLSTGSEYSSIPDELRDPRFTDSNGGRDLAARFASDVTPDEIVAVERRDFAGHVYNLQTGGGWYAASSIVVHNCRHTLIAVYPGITVLPERTPWTDVRQAEYDASQKQRQIEREIRRGKQHQRDALTPEARKKATIEVRKAQARMRELIALTGRARDPRREQLNLRQDRSKLTPTREGPP